MEYLKNEELISLKSDLLTLNSSLKPLFPDLPLDLPDFKSYSHALNFLKSQHRLFISKFQELHNSISQTRYGQQFFKVSSDLAQAKGKLKTREDAITQLRKENELLQRELSMSTGKIDSSSLLIENDRLKSKVLELQEEAKVLKNLMQEQQDKIIEYDYELETQPRAEPTPRFMDRLEIPSPMQKSFSSPGKAAVPASPRASTFPQDLGAPPVTGKKSSETVIELFDSGDLSAAANKWKETNFYLLETASERQNFDLLRKVLVFTIKASENLSTNLTYDPSKPSEILKLEDENLKLRKKLAEKSSKLSSLYESQELKKEEEDQQPELETLKKLVYETSAHSIFLENQIALIKSRAPTVPKLTESLMKGQNSQSVLADFVQSRVLEELERVQSSLVINLRGSLLQVLKEKTELYYESVTSRFRVSALEKLLEEERQMQRLLKNNKGISGLENWKAYKRDYLARVELAYKTEIKELSDTILKLKNELKITSSEIEERYIKELQELTSKLKKEHQDKKKLAELLSKARNIRQEEIIEQKYADCKEALQESNKKIYQLEQETFAVIEEKQELAQRVEQMQEDLQVLADEKEKALVQLKTIEKTVKVQEEERKQAEVQFSQTFTEKEQEIIELKETNENLQNYIQGLEKSVKEEEFKRKEIEHSTISKISETSKELQEIRQKFNRGKEKKRLSIIQVQNTQQNFENALNELQVFKEQLENEKKINEKIESEKEDLQDKVKKIEQEVFSSLQENKSLVSKLQEMDKIVEIYNKESRSNKVSIQNLEKKLMKSEETFNIMEGKLTGEKEKFLSKIEYLENLLDEKQQEISSKSKELSQIMIKANDIEELSNLNQELQSICENLKHSKQVLASQIKDFYLSFCKESKIEPPLLSSESDDMLYEIYMHLISLCRTLNTSQQHIDISFEEPQATNDDYKIKYNDLMSKSALNRIEDSKKIIETLREAKNLYKIDNLQDWVVEKWNASIEECDKLRAQLNLANQELGHKIKRESSNYLEKAKEEFKNYKQEIEKQSSENLNNQLRNTSLLHELEYLKQEKQLYEQKLYSMEQKMHSMEQKMHQKVAAVETDMIEWRSCFHDLYSQLAKSQPKSDLSPLELRNEITSLLTRIEKRENDLEKILKENANLAKLTENYIKDLERSNEEIEYLQRNLKDSSDLEKENQLLRSKFSDLIDEKEYLENKLNYIQNELLPTSFHEDKLIREALENELLNKCELVKQLAEEIEKFKKFIKIRECEYQELLTLKDEEILRMRLRSS